MFMTLTIGDLAALTGMITTLMTVEGVVVRYFVKSEIKFAIDALRYELAEKRMQALESRVIAPVLITAAEAKAGKTAN